MRRQKIRLGIVIVSFILFPITINYHSPAVIIAGAAQGIIVGSFILFAMQFLSSLLLGRAWCGWVCAGAGLQDSCAMVRDKKARGGKADWIKWLLWVPWIGVIAFFAFRAGGFTTVDPLMYTSYGVSVDEPSMYIVYYFFVGLIVVLAWTAGKRAFCHYVCWMAPFMIIGTKIRNIFKWPSLHLRAYKDKCVECGACDKACPMSLDVTGMVLRENMENAECILCGTCVDSCRKNAISFAFLPARHKVQSTAE